MYKEIFEIDKKYPSLIMKIVSKSNHTLKYFFKDVMFNWTFLYIARKLFWRRWFILFQRRHFKL